MSKESTDQDEIRKNIDAIRTTAELLLKSQARVTDILPVKIFGWLPQIATETQNMERNVALPHVRELDELLKGTGEPTPHNVEEVKALLEKLETPEFQKSLQRRL